MPLAEHDLPLTEQRSALTVSIHVPLAEHDVQGCNHPRLAIPFQFTCPSRSTTNPRRYAIEGNGVSIHVPLAEHDVRCSGGGDR